MRVLHAENTPLAVSKEFQRQQRQQRQHEAVHRAQHPAANWLANVAAIAARSNGQRQPASAWPLPSVSISRSRKWPSSLERIPAGGFRAPVAVHLSVTRVLVGGPAPSWRRPTHRGREGAGRSRRRCFPRALGMSSPAAAVKPRDRSRQKPGAPSTLAAHSGKNSYSHCLSARVTVA